MTKIDLGIYFLTALSIVAIVVLSVLEKELSILVPTLTCLIGIIVGKQGPAIEQAIRIKIMKVAEPKE